MSWALFRSARLSIDAHEYRAAGLQLLLRKHVQGSVRSGWQSGVLLPLTVLPFLRLPPLPTDVLPHRPHERPLPALVG